MNGTDNVRADVEGMAISAKCAPGYTNSGGTLRRAVSSGPILPAFNRR